MKTPASSSVHDFPEEIAATGTAVMFGRKHSMYRYRRVPYLTRRNLHQISRGALYKHDPKSISSSVSGLDSENVTESPVKGVSSAEEEVNKIAPNLEEMSNCNICCQKYNEDTKLPKILFCGHTFCAKCISKFLEFGKTTFVTCPVCRFETIASEKKIPTNYAIFEFLAKQNLLAESGIVENGIPIDDRSAVEKQMDEDSEDREVQRVQEGYDRLVSQVRTSVQARLNELQQDREEVMTREEIALFINNLTEDLVLTIDTAFLGDEFEIGSLSDEEEDNITSGSNSSTDTTFEESSDDQGANNTSSILQESLYNFSDDDF